MKVISENFLDFVDNEVGKMVTHAKNLLIQKR
ncbi:hypothetical protein ambt_00175 [Alteromonas naphthalenivorans]|jgi:hypothetical protein|uniref:Uncharacterized protein n=1 Tax=Alteromonas naphthalenivorans TaxID=715451 RepID=F5Z9Y4_ALTNA|nr:hypothetical protein ambt_00175 [Alteromonas naphthalenivorans]